MRPARISNSATRAMAWIVCGLRLALGAVFFAAGILKIGSPNDTAQTIAAFRILPGAVIAPLAIFLPIFELGLGGYLLLGLFTRLAALIAAAQLVVFATAIGSVVARGIITSCGCFGPADTAPATWLDVGRDIVLAAVAAFVAWKAPGKFALDQRLTAEQRSQAAS